MVNTIEMMIELMNRSGSEGMVGEHEFVEVGGGENPDGSESDEKGPVKAQIYIWLMLLIFITDSIKLYIYLISILPYFDSL